MTKARPDDQTKKGIIALAKATYGNTTQVAIAKAAGEALYDPLMESKKNIQVICAHMQQFPFDNPENFALKAYGFAKKKAEAEILEGLKQGLCEHEYLDGSKAPKETPAPSNYKTKPPTSIKQKSESGGQESLGLKQIIVEKPAVKPQEGIKAKTDKSTRRPSPPSSNIKTYQIKPGLTSLGITAESTYKINSTQGKPLQIKKIARLSPRLDPKKKEVRIISGMGLLEGAINNGNFVKDGYAPIISKNDRVVYVIDLPERVGILLPANKNTQLKSSVAEKLAEYVQRVKAPTDKNIINAVQQCKNDLTKLGSTFNMNAELKLMIFPVPTKNKTT